MGSYLLPLQVSVLRLSQGESVVGGQRAPYLQESSRDCRPHQPRAVPSSQLQSLEQEKGRWRVEKAQLEQSVEENKERMEKLEGYWGEAQSLCQAVDEHLRETQAQYQALERKYSKAKRLIKDYQQKYVWGLGALDLRRMERPVVAFPPHPSQLGGPGAQKLEGPVGGVPGFVMIGCQSQQTGPQRFWEDWGFPDLRTRSGQELPR